MDNKTGATRLGFAVLLRFFRREGRFPHHKHEVPDIVITFLATQVGVDATAYMQYAWQGRTIEYHRAQIREALGFRESSLADEELRREIHEGLNVIENWNSANAFIHYGKGGEFASNRLDDQEIAMLVLHLLQISMVYINTLMVQDVLKDDTWLKPLTKGDYRGLTPLFYGHIEPYGTLQLDMTQRLALA